MNVAAFVDPSGQLGDFYEDGQICLFGRVSNGWEKTKEVPLSLKREMSLAEIRATLAGSVSQLEDCEIFLVRELRGILRVYLTELGYRVWKSEGPLTDQLENVSLAEREMTVEERNDTVPAPLPVGNPADGCYRIDLVELLRSGVPHVSRDVLMPFFETVSFRRLEIFCEHVPKWFSMELEGLGLRVESQTPDAEGNGMTVVVVPKCGRRSCPPGKRTRRFSCNCGG